MRIFVADYRSTQARSNTERFCPEAEPESPGIAVDKLKGNMMVEEVYDNIFRIGVVLPGNPLKELNSYFIRGEQSDLLIDTGFRRDACREALEAGLRELGSDPARRDVLVTHLHSDHSGMADLFAGPERRIYLSGVDIDLLKLFHEQTDLLVRHRRFLEEGFPLEQLEEIDRTNPAMTERMPEIDRRLTALQDGSLLRAGGYTLETLLVPGHTPGNTMFYLRGEQIMFTGDHILFDITPNITHWPGFHDSLGSYLDQLRRVRDYPVKLALPGHRKAGEYRERIDSLLEHHRRRLANALSIVRENPGLTAYEIAGLMRWKIRAADWASFPVIQKWFAVGECLSHLDYLGARGQVRFETAGNTRRYFAV
ncbi:MAG: MBL fold metallo-hydrolase [Eubacteriales bacterium]|nr:MBL fold metallo-hydrolase [Eubacteriales bacterium]